MALMISDELEGRTRRRRRSWTDDEKWQIVLETEFPGSTVAGTARRHDVNANLLFKWIKQADAGRFGPRPMSRINSASIVESTASEFIPIGVFGHCGEEGPALIASPPVVPSGDGAAQPVWSGLPRKGPALDERPGVIEIDLPSGARIRVDAFVNAKALRRVLCALDGTS
jgi:transposase